MLHVFKTFRDNLYIAHMVAITEETLSNSRYMSVSEQNRLLSSANKIDIIRLDTLNISFTYNVNNFGQRLVSSANIIHFIRLDTLNR